MLSGHRLPCASDGVEPRSLSSPQSTEASGQAARRTSVNRHRIALSLEARLVQWLEWFQHSTTQWGLVTDVREDGTTYKRHGIVVELYADISRSLLDEEELARLRHAIDLMKLTLAVDPLAVKSLLMRRARRSRFENDDKPDPNISEHELKELAYGDAPFELRLQLAMEASQLEYWSESFVGDFMETPDQQDIDKSDVDDEAEVEWYAEDEEEFEAVSGSVDSSEALRAYLVDHVQQSFSVSRRLALVPVRTVLRVASHTLRATNFGSDDRLFDYVAAGSEALRVYQDQRSPKWTMATRLAPLAVERIDLRSGAIPLRAAILQAISVCVEKGVPVVYSHLTIDVRSMHCEESDLQRFLNAITAAATSGKPATFYTGDVHRESVRGDGGEDMSSNVLMLLRCIGRLECDVSLDLSGLFSVCQEDVNRQALIRGLVDYVFSRSTPVSLALIDDAMLADEDAIEFRREVARWRLEHPGHKLRLRSCRLRPEMGCVSCISALIEVLDDVEEFSLSTIDEFTLINDVKTVLQYPSLRSLILKNAVIPSMNIFAPRSGEIKLEKLVLGGLTLTDSASMVDFVKSLNPKSTGASSMARTLQRLSIAEIDGSVFWDNAEDEDEIVLPFLRLAINDPVVVPALHDVLAENTTLQYVNFIGDFKNSLPVMPVCDDNYPAKTSLISAPRGMGQRDLEKARRAALLSGIHHGNCISARALDSNMIRNVLDYAASPPFERKIRV